LIVQEEVRARKYEQASSLSQLSNSIQARLASLAGLQPAQPKPLAINLK
jgi:phosphoserine phosphatase